MKNLADPNAAAEIRTRILVSDPRTRRNGASRLSTR